MRIDVGDAAAVLATAVSRGVNLRQLDASTVTVALDETTRLEDVDELLAILNGGAPAGFSAESLAGQARVCVCFFLPFRGVVHLMECDPDFSLADCCAELGCHGVLLRCS